MPCMGSLRLARTCSGCGCGRTLGRSFWRAFNTSRCGHRYSPTAGAGVGAGLSAARVLWGLGWVGLRWMRRGTVGPSHGCVSYTRMRTPSQNPIRRTYLRRAAAAGVIAAVGTGRRQQGPAAVDTAAVRPAMPLKSRRSILSVSMSMWVGGWVGMIVVITGSHRLRYARRLHVWVLRACAL